MQAKSIAMQFIEDIKAQRFDEAKALIAPEGFEYIGPNMRFLNADDMLAYQFGLSAIQKDLVLRQLSADDCHVFAIINYRTDFEPIGDVRVALWFTIERGEIQKIESFYNAAVVESMLAGNLTSDS